MTDKELYYRFTQCLDRKAKNKRYIGSYNKITSLISEYVSYKDMNHVNFNTEYNVNILAYTILRNINNSHVSSKFNSPYNLYVDTKIMDFLFNFGTGIDINFTFDLSGKRTAINSVKNYMDIAVQSGNYYVIKNLIDRGFDPCKSNYYLSFLKEIIKYDYYKRMNSDILCYYKPKGVDSYNDFIDYIKCIDKVSEL